MKLVKHPLPSVDDVIAHVGDAEVFSKIDSKVLTTINTTEGLYQINYLPFGIYSSPGICQSFICKVLSGIDNNVVYQDDILIMTSSLSEHIIFYKVSQPLKETDIKLKTSKCLFYVDSVQYLGYIFDKEGVRPNTDKVSAIIDAPTPVNLKQEQSFLGLFYFYNALFLISLLYLPLCTNS